MNKILISQISKITKESKVRIVAAAAQYVTMGLCGNMTEALEYILMSAKGE